MKKTLSLIALVMAMMLAVMPLTALADEPKTLNIISWEGYVDEDTIAAFENETGIDVIWSPMSSIDEMLLKVQQSGGEGYDLILSSDYSLDILRQEGLLQHQYQCARPGAEPRHEIAKGVADDKAEHRGKCSQFQAVQQYL